MDDNLLNLKSVGAFLSQLAEGSEAVYWLSSSDFNTIEYVSPAYEKIWQRSRFDLYQDPRQWINHLHPDDATTNPIEEMTKKILAARDINEIKKIKFKETYRIIRPNGETRWILDRGFLVFDKNSQCFACTGVAIDITEMKNIENALTKKTEEAKKSDQAKTEFLMNMRHDFYTPFSGILGLTELMIKKETDQEKKDMLTHIYEATQSLLNQHNQIFEFAQLEEDMFSILEKKFNLRTLVKNQILALIPSAKEKNIQLDIIWEPENIPKNLIGDEIRLGKILNNLLTNAIKFTEKGNITLSTSLLKKNKHEIILKFSVKDTGIGIPKDKQNMVYEKFVKLNPSYQGVYNGMGCGLNTVKKFVRDLSGEIDLHSEPGIGSEFTILLPFKLSLLEH